MKISSLLTPERIIDLKCRTKGEALKELFRVIETAPEITDGRSFEKSIIERENVLTTGIGFEMAIPHVRLSSIKDFVMAIGRCGAGVDFDSLDGKPVKLIIMIASSDRQDRNEFLKVLAKAVMLFKDEAFRRKVLKADSSEAIFSLLKPY
jgi:mannitol/fructose-specific phosphotransferase system IIA component (Ntr-type)